MSQLSRLRSSIEKKLGHRVLPSKALSQHTIGGVKPWLVVEPQTEEEIVELVGLCSAGEAVIIATGGRHQLLDLTPRKDRRPFLVVSTIRLNQCIAHSHKDLTITVGSGMTLPALNERASEYGQYLPVDVAFRGTATVGGIIATNAGGLLRLKHGMISDHMLGATMVLPDGDLVKSGANTPKNVAGYDLHKLCVGSHGAFGILTQVTFRLEPQPEDFRMALIRVEHAEEAAHLISLLLRGRTRPAMLELANALAARTLGHELESSEMLLCVGYEDDTEAVEWQMTQLYSTLGERAILLDQNASQEEYDSLACWPERRDPLSFEAILVGAQCDAILDFCTQHNVAAFAHVGSGVVRGLGQDNPAPDFADALRQQAGPAGSVKFIDLPPESQIDRWGEVNQGRLWMRTIKQKFDPKLLYPLPGFLGAPATTT